MDDKIRKLLEQLGKAINESISSSEEVNGRIQQIRDEGYDLYVVLDATIGLGKADDEESPRDEMKQTARAPCARRAVQNQRQRSRIPPIGRHRSHA